jgi:hypothetical protein
MACLSFVARYVSTHRQRPLPIHHLSSLLNLKSPSIDIIRAIYPEIHSLSNHHELYGRVDERALDRPYKLPDA